MYLVFDTSVMIAAFLTPDCLSDRLMRSSLSAFLICTSDSIISEFKVQLAEKRIAEEEMVKFLDTYYEFSVLCDRNHYSTQKVDEDDHIIGCYQTCNADMIVTFDKGLLKKLKAMNIAGVHPSDLQHYPNNSK